jgi:ankyrin repeat protein
MPDLFSLAAEDDAEWLTASLPMMGKPASQIRNIEGMSLVLYCLFKNRERALAAVLTDAETLGLHEAAALGRVDRLRELVAQAPWSIDHLSPDGWGALHLAACFGRDAAVDALLDAGADTSLVSKGLTRHRPLHAAAVGMRLSPPTMERLARLTRPVDAIDADGFTALHIAALAGHQPHVEALLSAGADPRATRLDGETPADMALRLGHDEIAALLSLKN